MAKQKSHQGGTRDPHQHFANLEVVEWPTRPFVIYDDVITTGSQMIASCWRLSSAGLDPTLGVAIGRAVKEQKMPSLGWYCEAMETELKPIAYDIGGGTSVYESCPLQRCFRDMFAAVQHIGVQSGNFETCGRVMLGMEPGTDYSDSANHDVRRNASVLVVVAAMSGIGPTRTSRRVRFSAARGGEADISRRNERSRLRSTRPGFCHPQAKYRPFFQIGRR